MSNLVDYAKSEMRRIGYTGEEPESDPNRWMWDNIINVVQAFSDGGHSGFSAEYAVEILEKVLRYEPLSPLKYTDDEWIKHQNDIWQNKRKSTIFSDDLGLTWYDIEEKDSPRYVIHFSYGMDDMPEIPEIEVNDEDQI